MQRAQALTHVGQQVLRKHDSKETELALIKFAKLCEFLGISGKEIYEVGEAMIGDAIARPTAVTWYTNPYVYVQQVLYGKIRSPLLDTSSPAYVLMKASK
jgi:hypothetical protein